MTSVPRAILHVDMDAFFASIEQREQPNLRGRPVLVGGEGRRSVVAAASYEARTFGCHSAQPMVVARRLCPDAIIVPPRGRLYQDVSAEVFAILECFTPLVEPLSIDEAFCDVTGSQRLHGSGRVIAQAIRGRVEAELGLTASVGVAPNKFLAKLASDLDKPNGLTVIDADAIQQTIDPLPISRMWGVGPVTEKRLRDIGVLTFGDLARCPHEVLQQVLGINAPRIVSLARGRDQRRVVPDSRAKSISQEQTFPVNVSHADAVSKVLLGQVEQVSRRLRKHGYRATRASVKIRFGEFETITRSRTLAEPTDRTDILWRAGCTLFDRWAESSFRPVRLIGFQAGGLTTAGDQLHLFTHRADDRSKALDDVTDAIEQKYGARAIHRGGEDSPRRVAEYRGEKRIV